MCIDEKYFLDGDIDCQDGSDEQAFLSMESFSLCYGDVNMNCDDRISVSRVSASCGDGQMFYERLKFQQYRDSNGCISFRERQWRCEIHDDRDQVMWTNPLNGHCLDYVNRANDIVEEKIDCTFILKCAITRPGQHYRCPCTGNECRFFFHRYCDLNTTKLYPYPEGRVFSPAIQTYYQILEHDFNRNPNPDYFEIVDTVRCNNDGGSQIEKAVFEDWIQPFTALKDSTTWSSHSFVEYFLCSLYQNLKNTTVTHGDCWNDTYPNQAKLCPHSPPYICISKYQIKNGQFDCLKGELKCSFHLTICCLDDDSYIGEEEITDDIHANCSSTRDRRFQCSMSESTCHTIFSLGDGVTDCVSNYRDEYIEEHGIEISNLRCSSRDSEPCKFLRKYIEQSSLGSAWIDGDELIQSKLDFWDYCDSRWNKRYGEDEWECQHWKCPKHFGVAKFYRCQSGHCILSKYLCDGYWHCIDGSDEEGFQRITEDTIGEHNLALFQQLGTNLTEQKHKCLSRNGQRAFQDLCNTSVEYPCLLADVDDPWNFQLNRPCIPLSKLGDEHIDCYGGLDERMILGCGAFEKLGNSFKCQTTDMCIKQIRLCTELHRCPDRKDQHLCSYPSGLDRIRCESNKTLDHYKNARCLNGSCLPNALCNGIVECAYGEDEFFCSSSAFFEEVDYSFTRKYFLGEIFITLPNYFSSNLSKKSVMIPDQHENTKRKKSESLIGRYILKDHSFFSPIKTVFFSNFELHRN